MNAAGDANHTHHPGRTQRPGSWRSRITGRWREALALLWLSGFAAGAAADVTARLDPDTIDDLDTTLLILNANGSTPETPDLGLLARDFEILGTQTASKYQQVNGVVDASVEYRITLRPTRTGELTVPPITIGGAESPPLTLTVRAIDPDLRAAIDRMVFFEVELTRNPVYVRGETVLIRRLYYSSATQIYSDLPGAPELEAALVLPIGETRSTTAVRDGERYGVIEQRFALYPERAGTFTIPSISLTSSVRLQVDGRTRRTGARVSTAPLDVTVLPVPPEYPADTAWLPATAVELDDAWAPDSTTLRVGDSLRRRLTVAVAGNLAAAIAPPDDRLPERYLRQYPEPPALHDDRRGHSVTGTRSTAYAIVPTAPGTVELPAIAITWWDVDAQQVRTARTLARELAIVGEAPMATDTATDAGDTGVTTAADASPPATPEAPPARSMELPPGWTLGLSVAAAVLMIVVSIRLAHGPGWSTSPTRFARRLLVRIGLAGEARGPARRRRLRRLRRRLADRCRDGNPSAVEQALYDYLACWYRAPPLHAGERFRADGHAWLLERLQAARFGPAPPDPPSCETLLDALDALRPTPVTVPDALPELYGKR